MLCYKADFVVVGLSAGLFCRCCWIGVARCIVVCGFEWWFGMLVTPVFCELPINSVVV